MSFLHARLCSASVVQASCKARLLSQRLVAKKREDNFKSIYSSYQTASQAPFSSKQEAKERDQEQESKFMEFAEPLSQNLVIARGNTLSVYQLHQEEPEQEVKVQTEKSLSLYPLVQHSFNSNICNVAAIPTSKRDFLLILLEYNLTVCILYFNQEGIPVETSSGALKDESGEKRDGPSSICVDLVEQRFVSFHTYHGLLKIIPLAYKDERLMIEHSFDLYITHKEVISIELIQQSTIENAKPNIYYFVVLQRKIDSPPQIAIYQFDLVQRDIQPLSVVLPGEELEVNAQSTSLGIPVKKGALKIFPYSAQIYEDPSLSFEADLLLWTFDSVYLVNWSQQRLSEYMRKNAMPTPQNQEVPELFCRHAQVTKQGVPLCFTNCYPDRFVYINTHKEVLQVSVHNYQVKIDFLGLLKYTCNQIVYFEDDTSGGILAACHDLSLPHLYRVNDKSAEGTSLQPLDLGSMNQNRVNGGIVDFVLTEGEYASQMFTISGSPSSIQRIQMGTNVNADLGLIPNLSTLLNFWIVEVEQADFLILSFQSQTICVALEITAGSVELDPQSLQFLETQTSTLLVSTVLQSNFIQVTPSAVIISHLTTKEGTIKIQNQDKCAFEAAEINEHTLLVLVFNLASQSHQIHSYDLQAILKNPKKVKKSTLTFSSDNETSLQVSSFTLAPDNPSSAAQAINYEPIGVFGFWNVGSVCKIIHLNSEQQLGKIERNEGLPPTSILFIPFSQQNAAPQSTSYQLLIGYQDGQIDILLYHHLVAKMLIEGQKQSQETKIVSMRRLMAIGTSPIHLASFQNNDRQCVLVSCNFPSVLYWANELEVINSRLLFDPMIKSAELRGGAGLVIQSSSGLHFTRLKSISRLQADNFPSNPGQNVLSLCYIKKIECVAVISEVDFKRSAITLYRAGNMQRVGKAYELMENEYAQPILSYYQEQKQYLLIGSSIVVDNEFVPKQGRILALEIPSSDEVLNASEVQIFQFSAQKLLNAGVMVLQQLAKYPGCFLSGSGSTLAIFKFSPKMGTIDLISEKVATFHFIISIDNYENKIAVGDVIDSLQLFKFTQKQQENNQDLSFKIERIGKSLDCKSASVVLFVDQNTILVADDKGNLITFSAREKNYQTDLISRKDMLPLSGFKIGERVTMMKLGSLVRFSQHSLDYEFQLLPISNSVMYVTNIGTIGILLLSQKESTVQFLKNVEIALDSVLKPIGGISRIEYRNSWKRNNISTGLMRKSTEQATGFIDVDYLEYLQKLDPRKMQTVVDHASSPQSIMNNLPRDLQGVIGIIESLKRFY